MSFFLALLVAAAVAVVHGQPTPLQTLLTRSAADFPGKAGIWVKHLTTSETAGVRDGETFNSASVIKIPVLVQAFQMAERGELEPTDDPPSRPDRNGSTNSDRSTTSGVFR